MAWWREFGYFPPSRPRAAKGGIKAQSRGGTFGKSWWARRWIETLESFNIGARLQRGRSYARRGQVLSIEISKGTVSARVQGSRPKPYQIQIKVVTLSKAHWRRLADALGRQALFAARLLAGEMPEDIEKAFRSAGLSLFPGTSKDLQTACSCPDWSNPCKHIAAVYYLLGEEFDRDPFLIFRLRGMEREDLIRLIGGAAAAQGKGTAKKMTQAQTESEGESPSVPLSHQPGFFWGRDDARGDFLGEVRIPPVSAALLRRLGSFPFWRGEETFADAMEGVYREAASLGMDVFLGERTFRKGG
jgi:uncharacterized Zn finger protein